MSYVLPRQTAPEVDAGNPAHAVPPVGSFEQHGPYLPLITDTVVASLITGELAEAYGLFALPPVPVSCSHEHHAWRATVSVPSAVLAAYVSGICDSVAGSGFRSLILVNGHGGNYVLANVVQEASATGRRMALFPAREDWRKARLDAGLDTGDHEDMHAGELETSILLHAARAGWPSGRGPPLGSAGRHGAATRQARRPCHLARRAWPQACSTSLPRADRCPVY